MGIVNVTPDSFTGDGVGSDVDAAVARGESMIEAGNLDGDLSVVKPQQIGERGDIVVARMKSDIDDEATVKTFYKEGNRVRLQPENKFMEPVYTDKVEIIGKVSAVIRRL